MVVTIKMRLKGTGETRAAETRVAGLRGDPPQKCTALPGKVQTRSSWVACWLRSDSMRSTLSLDTVSETTRSLLKDYLGP